MKMRMLLPGLLICSCPLLAHAQYQDPYRDQPPPPPDTYRDAPPPPDAYRDEAPPPPDDYRNEPPPPPADAYRDAPPPDEYRDEPPPPRAVYRDDPRPAEYGNAPPPPPVRYRDDNAPPPPPVHYRDTPPPPVRYRDTSAPPAAARVYRDDAPAPRDPYAGNAHSAARYYTPDGQVTVRTSQPGPRDFGPPPDFNQIDRSGAGYVTPADAAAYPPLANDFIYADSNRDGRVSRAEYQRWAAHR